MRRKGGGENESLRGRVGRVRLVISIGGHRGRRGRGGSAGCRKNRDPDGGAGCCTDRRGAVRSFAAQRGRERAGSRCWYESKAKSKTGSPSRGRRGEREPEREGERASVCV